MTKKMARFYFNSRQLMPIMLGLIVGITFNLFCISLYDCDNNIEPYSNLTVEQVAVIRSKLRDFRDEEKHLSGFVDDYEPRINLQDKPKKPSKPSKKLIRPRYLATELKIRKSLFIGILSSSRQLSSFTSYYNETLSQIGRLTFFVNDPNMNEDDLLKKTPAGISVVNFNDGQDHFLPLHALKYVQDNFLTKYDWFFFVTDRTFIRASMLMKTVQHISISQDVYMGYPMDDRFNVYCSLESGILLSNTLVGKMQPQMDWCTKNAFSMNPTENIGRCVLHTTNLKCARDANGFNVDFHLDTNLNFDLNLPKFIDSSDFNRSLTVGRINDIQTMKKLQMYFNKVDMTEIETNIKNIKDNIYETVCETNEGCDSLVWPLGVPEPYKAKNRHEIIRWDYFNSTHVFLLTDFDNINEMSPQWKRDIDEIVSFAMSQMNAESTTRYRLLALLNGYKQLDPTRGASYILDLKVYDRIQNENVHKRVNLLRPLGLMEIIPMAYVTESSKVTLVVYYTQDYDFEKLSKFLKSYETLILNVKETSYNINLFLVFLTDSKRDKIQADVNFRSIKNKLELLIKKHGSLSTGKSRIIQTKLEIKNSSLYYNEDYQQMITIEFLSNQLSGDALIFMGTPCVEIDFEFLNRVRLNTIKSSQVFVPIPFNEFMPSLVYPLNEPRSERVVINKFFGYFSTASFNFVSFYNSDYIESKTKFQQIEQSEMNMLTVGLHGIFLRNKELHVMRATDQSFKCRWSLTENCQMQTSKEKRELCVNKREIGLGTKAQLASYLINNYEIFFSYSRA